VRKEGELENLRNLELELEVQMKEEALRSAVAADSGARAAIESAAVAHQQAAAALGRQVQAESEARAAQQRTGELTTQNRALERERKNAEAALKEREERLKRMQVKLGEERGKKRAAQKSENHQARKRSGHFEELAALERKFGAQKNILEAEKREAVTKLKRLLKGKIETFKGGKFVDTMRCLGMHLLTLGVKAKKFEPIVRGVMRFLCPDLKLGRLPSTATLGVMRTELEGVTGSCRSQTSSRREKKTQRCSRTTQPKGIKPTRPSKRHILMTTASGKC
jgi:hypothetical protein